MSDFRGSTQIETYSKAAIATHTEFSDYEWCAMSPNDVTHLS
ncbi:hypothetical protein SAMN04488518_11426 [Pseudovibrio ascidiaceicola]|uniref:Uncharacterized protein n=1 Tax=Pseudovibrio ascidiaceicola TaxID=285279 RepID=A0A1I4E8V9_9HYPH|nr:hypothetical protein SAMN04488518_11426 [Pseudovibrio ascidiaceicola]